MKLGRRPRGHDPRIPHLSALLAGATPTPPPAVDYTKGMPSYLGAMLNTSLGDCTCAAFGHAIQVWTANTETAMATPTDDDVLGLYEGACGYQPGNPSTDQGGVEQDVLSYLLKTPFAGSELAAFIEIDPRNMDDLRNCVYWCGVVYLGFNVPAYLMNGLTDPGAVWDVNPGADNSIIGGHAVIWPGYNTNFRTVSWGNYYEMTPAFVLQFVDEAYALVDPDWFATTGLTPAGMTVAQLQQQMQGLTST